MTYRALSYHCKSLIVKPQTTVLVEDLLSDREVGAVANHGIKAFILDLVYVNSSIPSGK